MKILNKKTILLSSVLALTLGFAGCGDDTTSNNDSGSNTNQNVTASGPVTASFIDDPVKGISYNCVPSGTQGVTNVDGNFTCLGTDETVSFSLGNYNLGEASANGDSVSPLTLFPTDIESSTNLAQLLQTLDVDGNATNGLDLTTPSALAYIGRLNDALSDTQNDIKLTSRDFDTVLANALGTDVVSEERAVETMNAYLAAQGLVQSDIYKMAVHTIKNLNANGDLNTTTLDQYFTYYENQDIETFGDNNNNSFEQYTYTYNDAGALATKTTRNPSLNTFTYKNYTTNAGGGDANRSEITIDANDTKTETYTYNADNTLMNISETHTAEDYFSGLDTNLTYNDEGLLLRKQTVNKFKTSQGAFGNKTTQVFVYTYDTNDTTKIATFKDVPNNLFHTYTYDANSTLDLIRTLNPFVTKSRTKYEYDENSRLKLITLYDKYARPVTFTTYSYDENANITKIYTAENNITPAELMRSITEDMTYDEAGNLTKSTKVIENTKPVDTTDKYTQTVVIDYTYNGNNKILTESKTESKIYVTKTAESYSDRTSSVTNTYDAASGYLTKKVTVNDDNTSVVEDITWTNIFTQS